MIISHSRRFVFIETFKTAGSSLENALSKLYGKDDGLSHLEQDLAEVCRRIGLNVNLHGELRPIRAKADLLPETADHRNLLEDHHRALTSLLCAKEIARFYADEAAEAGGAMDGERGMTGQGIGPGQMRGGAT
jgi:hypothetical protein